MKTIIYGAGAEGQRALEDIGRENVFCIVDQKKRGAIDGCPIYSLTELSVPDKDDVLFLITPRRYRHEIAEDLRQAGYRHFCLYTHVSGGGVHRERWMLHNGESCIIKSCWSKSSRMSKNRG